MGDIINTARIIYISLTVLTALAFAFSDITGWDSRMGNVLWAFFWIGSSALFAGWMSWHWLHPVTWSGYLFCALLCVVLFHVGLAIGVGLNFIIMGSWWMDMNIFSVIGTGLLGVIGCLVVSFMKVGLYTLWLCLQTALITKGIVWIIGRCNQ